METTRERRVPSHRVGSGVFRSRFSERSSSNEAMWLLIWAPKSIVICCCKVVSPSVRVVRNFVLELVQVGLHVSYSSRCVCLASLEFGNASVKAR